MAPKFYETEVTDVTQLTNNVKDITFSYKDSDEMQFKGGQFVTLQLYDENGKMVSRAYSIASSPVEINKINICVKILEEGKGTKIIDQLKVGDTVKMFGPAGFFIFDSKTKKNILICTGTGVAPFIAMLEEQLTLNESKDSFNLIFGVQNQSDILYEEKWKELAKKHPNFLYTVCLSKQDIEHHFSGRVTKCLSDTIGDFQDHDYYICGVGEMVNDVIEILVKSDVPDERIHYERYS